jgi:hypothetical protein
MERANLPFVPRSTWPRLANARQVSRKVIVASERRAAIKDLATSNKDFIAGRFSDGCVPTANPAPVAALFKAIQRTSQEANWARRCNGICLGDRGLYRGSLLIAGGSPLIAKAQHQRMLRENRDAEAIHLRAWSHIPQLRGIDIVDLGQRRSRRLAASMSQP